MPDSRDPQLDDLRRRARRRLIGAIVLALAAAVLVPLLLESDPKPLGEDVAVKIPPISEGKFASKVGEKRKGAEPASAAEAKVEAAPPVAATATEAAKDVAKDAVKAPTETPKESATAVPATPMAKSLASAEQRVLAPPAKAVPAPAPAPAKVAAPPAAKDVVPAPAPKSVEPAPKAAEPKAAEADKSTGHAVQLAAFTDDKGANALAAKLKRSGYPAYTEPYDTSRGKLWRVRVGPYPSRDAAEEVRAKLKAEGQSGFIAAAK